MPVNNVDEFLVRTRTALDMPTLYWLGYGGWKGDEPHGAAPGTRIDAAAQLAQLKEKDKTKYDAYMGGARQAGLDLAQLPGVACDCSGFVAWALGIARYPARLAGSATAWLNTNAMHADAKGEHQMFSKLAQPRVGALLVYPGVDAQHKIGHVAIITEVVGGKPTRMIHCAPDNYLLAPAPGKVRNAIAETGTEHFAHEADTLVAMWNPFV